MSGIIIIKSHRKNTCMQKKQTYSVTKTWKSWLIDRFLWSMFYSVNVCVEISIAMECMTLLPKSP